jgi:hypothetical protein
MRKNISEQYFQDQSNKLNTTCIKICGATETPIQTTAWCHFERKNNQRLNIYKMYDQSINFIIY